MCRKNTQEIRAIEKGFTSQFTNKVTSSPRGFSRTLKMDAKSTFIIIGMIISQIRMAMGTLTWLPWPNSSERRLWTNPGMVFPRATPIIMQSATQSVR